MLTHYRRHLGTTKFKESCLNHESSFVCPLIIDNNLLSFSILRYSFILKKIDLQAEVTFLQDFPSYQYKFQSHRKKSYMQFFQKVREKPKKSEGFSGNEKMSKNETVYKNPKTLLQTFKNLHQVVNSCFFTLMFNQFLIRSNW